MQKPYNHYLLVRSSVLPSCHSSKTVISSVNSCWEPKISSLFTVDPIFGTCYNIFRHVFGTAELSRFNWNLLELGRPRVWWQSNNGADFSFVTLRHHSIPRFGWQNFYCQFLWAVWHVFWGIKLPKWWWTFFKQIKAAFFFFCLLALVVWLSC